MPLMACQKTPTSATLRKKNTEHSLLLTSTTIRSVGAPRRQEMLEQTVAAVTTRRAPIVLITGLTVAAFLGLGAADAAAQKVVLNQPAAGGSPVALEGELEVLYEDHEDRAELVHFIHANRRRIRVKFDGRVAPDLMTGSRVRVRGNLADGTVTASSLETLAASTSWTTGSQTVLVILFNFSNNRRSRSRCQRSPA